MLKIPKLDFGFNDAENYRMKEYKELFNDIFLQTEALDQLCKNNNFFLIGNNYFYKPVPEDISLFRAGSQ